MSAKWMGYFFDETDLQGSELLLALAIADHADADGKCFPGVEKLAKKIRLKPRQTQVLLKRLEEKGVVKIEHGQGRGHTSHYALQKVQSSAPITDEEKVHSGDIKGAFSRQEKVHSGAPPIYKDEPSLEPSERTVEISLSSAGATPQENESDNHTQTIPYPPLQSEKKSPPPRRPMTPDEAAAYLDTAPAPAPPDPEFQTPAMVAYFDHFPTALPNGEFVRLINAHCVNLEAWKKTLTIAIAAKWRNIYNVQAFTETYDREVKKIAPKQIGIYEHPKVNKPKFLH